MYEGTSRLALGLIESLSGEALPLPLDLVRSGDLPADPMLWYGWPS